MKKRLFCRLAVRQERQKVDGPFRPLELDVHSQVGVAACGFKGVGPAGLPAFSFQIVDAHPIAVRCFGPAVDQDVPFALPFRDGEGDAPIGAGDAIGQLSNPGFRLL